jgi:hypothetical protein
MKITWSVSLCSGYDEVKYMPDNQGYEKYKGNPVDFCFKRANTGCFSKV